MNEREAGKDDEKPLLAYRAYVLFLTGRFLSRLSTTSQTIVIAWEVYERARGRMTVEEGSFLLGMIGLAQFVPLVLLTLPAGDAADRHDRRRILLGCFVTQVMVSLGLAAHGLAGPGLWPIFALAGVLGVSRAFFQPAATALAPNLVPLRLLPRAIAANSLAFEVASILGPALGGWLCGWSPRVGYLVSACLYAGAVLTTWLVRVDTRPAVEVGRSRSEQVRKGLRYVWSNKLVLGAISLDLFAVLLGGATALLPVFAKDVLHVGPEGYGLLRAAPAVGAMVMAGLLAVRPIRRHAGTKMFLAVAVYGVMTIVFGLSRSMGLSLLALVVLGGADMVSVFTRQSLVQIATPDAMRGRVSSVSTLFVSASNELGEFESGVVARWLGPVRAVLWGGIGSLVVTGVWARWFPTLRKADRLV
jgi:MFS family permease